ncbi:MAG TPA: phosphomannomutase/phosphoglucomutase [Ornithinimicrobium sp.]|uniref:phosphomannomutase/phosphoglucomutase n=1 Tax=Ornithinimicrobium sp. TaxID=1977084 RepID=UPI002B488DAA|nr:phosphomannomutase/phosphoglucomutase [Ornithinimicrobium sp.]HKJ12605.1 phosphomannomutase/phosphoglucomutase [Ornithinimicrobium sp.]
MPDLFALTKAHDVRGLVPGQLTPGVSRALGLSFAHVVVRPGGHEQMVLGRDMRASSPELAEAFAGGVSAGGVDVLDIGECATDQLYFASGKYRSPGAMVTASHNPASYNGIKLCRSDAVPLALGSGLTEVRDLAQWLLDRGEVHGGALAASRPGARRRQDTLPDYAAYLHSLVDLENLRPLRIVVDAGNGMAGLTAPAVLGAIGSGCEMVGLHLTLDGSFPHHEANPLDPSTLVDLQQAVLREGADLGLAFDGDADRCFVVDERARPVTASAVTALVAAREIDKERARGVPATDITIVHNATCSRSVPQLVRRLGARPVRTRVGHSYVKEAMAEHDAVFGGEHSGHYYFRDFWRADTGMLAALHVLAALGGSAEPVTMSELARPFDPYVQSGEMNFTVADVPDVIQRVRQWAEAADPHVAIDTDDGLGLVSVAGQAGFWSLSLRASNTEPLLRLNVEAADAQTMDEIRDHVCSLITAAEAGCPRARSGPQAG